MADAIREAEAKLSQEKPYNAADEKSVNEARKRAGRKKIEDLNIIKAMMDLLEGRKYLYELMEACHIFGNCFYGEEPNKTAFSLGERNVGLRVLAHIMESAPDLYTQMCKENKS